jgi:hypothetical protein
MSENWISVKDRLPEHLDKVLVTFEDSDNILMASFSAQFDEFAVYWADGRKVPSHTVITHWMPLPEPPKV